MAARAKKWQRVVTQERGQEKVRLLYCRILLWYNVCKDKPILLVISRDPTGHEHDDFFFTTNVSMSPATLISGFADRWAIEDTFRNVKQFLGAEQPQCWKGQGPERVVAFSYVLYGVIWSWYLQHGYHPGKLTVVVPWYPQKCTPSFRDALASLRKQLWERRFLSVAKPGAQLDKFQRILIQALAEAA